jgi:hypothetical protein
VGLTTERPVREYALALFLGGQPPDPPELASLGSLFEMLVNNQPTVEDHETTIFFHLHPYIAFQLQLAHCAGWSGGDTPRKFDLPTPANKVSQLKLKR